MSDGSKGSPTPAPRLMMVGVDSRSPILSMAYNIKQRSSNIDAVAAKALVSAAYSSEANGGGKEGASSPPANSGKTAGIEQMSHERLEQTISKTTSPVKAQNSQRSENFSPSNRRPKQRNRAESMPPVPSPPRIRPANLPPIGGESPEKQKSSKAATKKALPVVTPALSPKRLNRFSPTGGVSPPPSKQSRDKADEAEMLRKKKLMEAEQRMEQMEREARKLLLNTMREQEQEMERKKRAVEAAKSKEAAKGHAQVVRKRNVGASRKNREAKRGSGNGKLLKEREKKPAINDVIKTLPSTWRLVAFLLFLFVCLSILYFGFGNTSAPLASNSHVVKDKSPPTIKEAGVVLDKDGEEEGKDTPQVEVRKKKNTGSKKRPRGRKKKRKKKTSE